ncbi:MAG TPA: GTP cyclohydrolase I [bacterium]|nr:GTP cyclohydrolase I [bacterium]
MDPHKLQQGFRLVLEGLGLDDSDPVLKDTARRTAEAWSRELCVGLVSAEPDLDLMLLEEGQQPGLIALDSIPVKSVCAHHLLPFIGVATVAYVPHGAICGLSKLSRVVDHFARRPQVQERLTHQVAQYLQRHLQPLGVGVSIQASHFCMDVRGVNHSGLMTTTSLLGSLDKNAALRAEFQALCQNARPPAL